MTLIVAKRFEFAVWAVLFVLLATLIAWEAAGNGEAQSFYKIAIAPAQSLNIPLDLPSGAVDDILSRPLFSSSRRSATASKSAMAGLPRLTAIIIGPRDRVALFAPNDNARPFAVREDADVGEYHIVRIDAGEVKVDGPNGEHILRPQPSSPTEQR